MRITESALRKIIKEELSKYSSKLLEWTGEEKYLASVRTLSNLKKNAKFNDLVSVVQSSKDANEILQKLTAVRNEVTQALMAMDEGSKFVPADKKAKFNELFATVQSMSEFLNNEVSKLGRFKGKSFEDQTNLFTALKSHIVKVTGSALKVLSGAADTSARQLAGDPWVGASGGGRTRLTCRI